MRTSRMPSEYYTTDEVIYRNNKTRNISHRNDSPYNTGVITNKTKNGTYNIIEKDFGDHKIIYHVPIEYGDDYDVSQLEDIPIFQEEQQQKSRNSPKLVRRRIYQQYNDVDYDDDDDGDIYEYVEEVPVVTSRRPVYASPRRQRVEYIYEDDYSDNQDYRIDNEEQVEYLVRERVPKQIYMEEPRPTRRTVYVQDSSEPPLSPPPHPPPPASYSPRRSSYQSSPRPAPINQKSPSPIRRNNLSPPLSTRKQQTIRSPIYESPVKPNIPKTNEPPLRLMDVIAQNRAKRGPGIPKPRREIDEAKAYDPPTYKKNIIKNGFIVHK